MSFIAYASSIPSHPYNPKTTRHLFGEAYGSDSFKAIQKLARRKHYDFIDLGPQTEADMRQSAAERTEQTAAKIAENLSPHGRGFFKRKSRTLPSVIVAETNRATDVLEAMAMLADKRYQLPVLVLVDPVYNLNTNRHDCHYMGGIHELEVWKDKVLEVKGLPAIVIASNPIDFMSAQQGGHTLDANALHELLLPVTSNLVAEAPTRSVKGNIFATNISAIVEPFLAPKREEPGRKFGFWEPKKVA